LNYTCFAESCNAYSIGQASWKRGALLKKVEADTRDL
jgi:hypothetical protein